ncbi:hypothetical protein [Pseudomonas pohangensis]|jgi:hypothetical protein|uniref:hypothetical protein n=1 Tax=Pseudomonas pohangensis TaxID=364197 RepID=UPI001560D42E|nr:hypothetical protein [Pseudomonas pohangensis]
MERRLPLWLRRLSACFARFLAEGELATVKLLEKILGETNKAANNAEMKRACQADWRFSLLVWPAADRYTRFPDRARPFAVVHCLPEAA